MVLGRKSETRAVRWDKDDGGDGGDTGFVEKGLTMI